MSIYLIVVMLTLPGQNAPSTELTREWTTASSAAVCQARADVLAGQERAKQSAVIERMKASVKGVCVKQGETT